MCGIHMNGDIIAGRRRRDLATRSSRTTSSTTTAARGGSAINGDGVADSVIRNNVLDDNHASGISLYQIDGGAPSTGNLVVNNTIRMATTARWAINIQDGSTRQHAPQQHPARHGRRAAARSTSATTCCPGLVADHNAVDRRDVDRRQRDDARGLEVAHGHRHGLVRGDRRRSCSRARRSDARGRLAGDRRGQRDRRTARPTSTGTARPQGAAVDIGAYEHCDGTCAGAGSGSDAGSDSGSDAGSDDTGSSGGSNGDNPGSDYSGPTHTPSSGGCAVGGNAGIAVALSVLLVRRRRRR